MTGRELYTAYMTLADQAGQAHLVPAKFGRLYWVCLIDFLREQARQPSSEVVKAALRPFRRRYDSPVNPVPLATVRPVVMLIRAVTADFGAGRLNMPVSPVDEDEAAEAELDPFRRSSMDEPHYLDDANGQLLVLGPDKPLGIRISYLTYPERMDVTSTDERPEGEDTQLAVLRRVVAEKDLIDEKYNRYTLLANRVIPSAEKPI